MTRSTFLYQDPKVSHDFSQCKTCWKFTGKTCLEFSSKDKIIPEGSCNLYSTGTPQPDHVGKEKGGYTPEQAGYVERKVRCEHCVFYEVKDRDCLFFRSINISDYKVDKDGCCTNNTPIDTYKKDQPKTIKKLESPFDKKLLKKS